MVNWNYHGKRGLHRMTNTVNLTETKNTVTVDETKNTVTLNENSNKVTVDETSNIVTVDETKNEVTVDEISNTVTVTEGTTQIVDVITEGPRGPAGSGFDIDTSAKVNQSVVYYDSTAGQFKADDTWTIKTLVFGGDF